MPLRWRGRRPPDRCGSCVNRVASNRLGRTHRLEIRLKPGRRFGVGGPMGPSIHREPHRSGSVGSAGLLRQRPSRRIASPVPPSQPRSSRSAGRNPGAERRLPAAEQAATTPRTGRLNVRVLETTLTSESCRLRIRPVLQVYERTAKKRNVFPQKIACRDPAHASYGDAFASLSQRRYLQEHDLGQPVAFLQVIKQALPRGRVLSTGDDSRQASVPFLQRLIPIRNAQLFVDLMFIVADPMEQFE